MTALDEMSMIEINFLVFFESAYNTYQRAEQTVLSAISNSKELTSETAILYLHQHERKQ